MGCMQGRRIHVTGGGRNIGRAIAAAAAGAGAAVAILEKEPGAAGEAVAAIAAAGGRAMEVAADLSDPAAVERAVAEAVAALGGLDGLVNNAGVYVRGPFLDLTPAQWDLSLGVNLRGAFLATRAFGRHLRERGGAGSVVNIASVHGTVGDADMVAHGASKAGLLGFTRSAAEALRPLGIRVNAVSPGAVATWKGPFDAPVPGRPLEEILVPRQVAEAVVWLLSDEASGVTGIDLPVGGGTAVGIRVPG